MYKISKATPFFFRRAFFCGGRRGFPESQIGSMGRPTTTTSHSSGVCETNDYSNKPYYFQVKFEDRFSKKIDKVNDCFRNFYYNHGGQQYTDKFEGIFDTWEHEFSKTRGFRSPKTFINESDKGIDIRVELPGFSKEDVKIDFSNGILSIDAVNKTTSTQSQAGEQPQSQHQFSDVHRIQEKLQHSNLEFKKSIKLPEDIDTSLIKAIMNNGILDIIIPKNSYVKSTTINVQ
ncbi:hypothetical protein RB653_008776 [Dictyostelium firmibasis]|uniref:SHSP domain-containing protein n=1 Tax=Dictyostelium firmibasis TaxID=79012 RepID=A0AAN7YWU9_9MYCE